MQRPIGHDQNCTLQKSIANT